jgi:hypothetical protein
MKYHIQKRHLDDRTWYRVEDEGPFDTALDALECRDEITSDFPNDGMDRACRVVDDDGNVIEYGRREV